ncbi:MAG: peptidyl-tRNA hydrolase Pth2 [Candidatus Micrarchaeota archaeon]|nr:peptidyl-tRNA hydrolase Pth2 [Candidatus Micrarchaeota archaeon]
MKQVIIIRNDIHMSKGKTIAQGAHASLMSYFNVEKIDKKIAQQWLDAGEKKIVLKVQSDKELKRLAEGFKYKKIPHALVTDAGLTELPPGTITALGAGPWNSTEIDMLTSGLKLL